MSYYNNYDSDEYAEYAENEYSNKKYKDELEFKIKELPFYTKLLELTRLDANQLSEQFECIFIRFSNNKLNFRIRWNQNYITHITFKIFNQLLDDYKYIIATNYFNCLIVPDININNYEINSETNIPILIYNCNSDSYNSIEHLMEYLFKNDNTKWLVE